MKRIGFVGTENSHTDHFIRFLNTENRHPGFRATALAGGANERNDTLASAHEITTIVDDPEDLIGEVDAVIISTRDGALHRSQAEPLLKAGLPVLVDKPLATSVADARAILAAADAGNAPLVSTSALRFVPEIAELTPADSSALRTLSVVGPADPDSPYSGLFFYGIHNVEAALELLGNPVVDASTAAVDVDSRGDTTIARTRIHGVDVTLTFIVPSSTARVGFHAVTVATNGVLARPLTLDPDYNAPALARFIAACETGVSPVPTAQLLSPIYLMSAITETLTTRKDAA